MSYAYPARGPQRGPAVHDVSLSLADGELAALIGPTGSGKSTLVQLLAGLIRPSAGRVLIDGTDPWQPRVDRRRLRQRVGLVFQYPEHQLFEETVRADVAFGPRNLGLEPDEIEQRVRRSLRLVGLDAGVLERSPLTLSGGQMRRVAIAGVLAMKPRHLILDEPTAGLDPRGRAELIDLLRRLNRQEGMTILLVSHNMDEVARLAQRVFVLDGGRLALAGPVRQVYRHVERLRALGLDVPLPTRLVSALADRGWPLDRDALTADEAAAAIAAALAVRAPSSRPPEGGS
ncbi:MAG TPA: energy-coupling factor transporter ATPase [Bacillota bacterium]